jgi:hypothetical protein
MSSNPIYTPKQHPSFYAGLGDSAIHHKSNKPHTPYTYLIGWSNLNIFYYGAKWDVHAHPSKFFNFNIHTPYLTSSKVVKEFIVEYGLPDIIIIRNTFKSANQCIKTESKVTSKIYKLSNWLNQVPAKTKFNSTGLVPVKGICGNFMISVDDPRYGVTLFSVNQGRIYSDETKRKISIASSKLIHSDETKRKISKSKLGTTTVKTLDGKMMQCSIYDPHYISGEYTSITTGTVCVKDKEGNKFKCYTTDPKYISGEYVYHKSGSKQTELTKQKMRDAWVRRKELKPSTLS